MKIPKISLTTNAQAKVSITVSGKHMPFQRRRQCLNCGKAEVQKKVPLEKREKWHVFFWECLQHNEQGGTYVNVEPSLLCRECSYSFVSLEDKGTYAYIPLDKLSSMELSEFTFCEVENGIPICRDVSPGDFSSIENARLVKGAK